MRRPRDASCCRALPTRRRLARQLERGVLYQALQVQAAMHIQFVADTASHGGRELAENGSLRGDELGQRRRLELVSGNLLDSGGKLRFDKLTHAWVIHLLANANGLAMQTQLIAVDTQPTLAAMPREQAAHALDAVLYALHQGMNSPLPIARRSAFAWLAAADGGKDPAKAAALSYDGSDYGAAPGEVRQDPYLTRAWPSFELLQQAGFEHWLSLYQPLTMALLPAEVAV